MNSENSPCKIEALEFFDKEIPMPTSKSHSNRALILGALRGNGFRVESLSDSSDVRNLLNTFLKIGLKIKTEGSSVVFLNSFPECEKETTEEIITLMTGDGGTTNRFLIALLARGIKEYRLFPTEKMRERPIEELLIPLKTMGVKISSSSSEDPTIPWVKIQGPASLNHSTKLSIDCSKSTQFATALMLAFADLPLQFDFINLKASATYLEMTKLVMKQSLEKNKYVVPVDFSSLSYPAALAALCGRVLITNAFETDESQADATFLPLLENCGARVRQLEGGLEIKNESSLTPFNFDVSQAPDLFPTLVFLASHIEGESTLFNLEVLQFKESDRLAQMIAVMKKFGVEFEYIKEEDCLKIKGSHSQKYKRAVIHPARDHRIVMASALFMAKNQGGELFEVDCVEKSFPTFLSLLE